MSLHENKHHQISHGKGVPYVLIKEILKRFCLKLIRFKTCVLEEKYILDTHHHVSFIHDSRESN